MAKILLTVDTDSQQLAVAIDGQPLRGVRDVRLVRSGAAWIAEVEADDPRADELAKAGVPVFRRDALADDIADFFDRAEQ